MMYIPDEVGFKCSTCKALFWIRMEEERQEMFGDPVHCPYCGDENLITSNNERTDELHQGLTIIDEIEEY